MTPNNNPRPALIYCRVSGIKQSIEGSGLDSQEFRCRQYADAKGYEVEAVFPDKMSGGGDFMKRPGMVALLSYLDAQSDNNYVVIFDDLKRYARDVEFHLKLRRMMSERNATRECLNFNFEDTPEGMFNETITAAAGAYERETMKRQNQQKSIARVEQGYCVQATPPIGYVYEKAAQGGKVLVRNEPYASIVQQALEGYASGHFASQVEVKRFLESQPQFPKGKNGTIQQQKIVKILRQKLYAGYVGVPVWGVSTRKGKHEGLISLETFEINQKKLDGGVYAPARKDIQADFPLRGAVCCSECTTPLTAGWSTGKYKKYPYYFCRSKGCAQYGKTIARKKIEGDFTVLLGALQPSKGLVKMAAAMFRDCWDQQLAQSVAKVDTFKQEALAAEAKINQLVERIMDASNPRVIAAYETNIEKLEREKLVYEEKARAKPQTRYGFDELFELSIRFLASPCKIWDSGRIEMQRLVLKLTFSEHLHYCRETGFRTPQTTVPFSFLGDFMKKDKMVLPGRIELPTSPLPRECSTSELRQQNRLNIGFYASFAQIARCKIVQNYAEHCRNVQN